MISDRERFIAIVSSTPLLRSDAVVVLAGQDGQERLKAGVQAMRMNGADTTLVLTGGLSGDGLLSAEDLESMAWGYGVSPDKIIVDNVAANTSEQAVNVVRIARQNGWRRMILVASPYHSIRAYLTFVKVIGTLDLHVVNLPASHIPWFKSPDGCKYTRDELLSGECGKVELYAEHVASYSAGIEYLERWEGR